MSLRVCGANLSESISAKPAKHIVAIASGKGGVGKSTTAVNIALGLQAKGFRVGVLDADIYGPSLQMLLGLAEEVRPEIIPNQGFKPVLAHGLQTMSMAYLVTEKTPMVWRGPMAGGALIQLLEQTHWQELDYLIVDMPPGTGDIQLTLSQKVRLSGAVIVSTPQDLALLDAKKGIAMFDKVNVPILGLVQNMATHICGQCGHEEPIFGDDGTAKLADEMGVELLGSLPLAMPIRAAGDKGLPVLAAEPGSSYAQSYLLITDRLIEQVGQQSTQTGPTISMSDD